MLATTAGLPLTISLCFTGKRRLPWTTRIMLGFWDYSGRDYYGPNGVESGAVKAMVDRLLGP